MSRIRQASEQAAARAQHGGADPVTLVVVVGIAGALYPATGGASLLVGAVVALVMVWVGRDATPPPGRASSRARPRSRRERVADRVPLVHPVLGSLALAFAVLLRWVAVCALTHHAVAHVAAVVTRLAMVNRAPDVFGWGLWCVLVATLGLALREAVRSLWPLEPDEERRPLRHAPDGMPTDVGVAVLVGFALGVPGGVLEVALPVP